MNPFTYNPFIQPGMASAAYASGMQSIGSPVGYNPHGSGLGFDAATLAFAGMSRAGMRPTEGQQMQANHFQRLSTQMQDFLNRHDARMSGIYSMVHQAIPVEQRAAFRRQIGGGPLGEFMGGLMNNTPLGQYLGGSMHSFGFGSLAIASQPMRQLAAGRGLMGPEVERLQFAGASRMALDLQRHFMTSTGALNMSRTGGLDRDRMGNIMAMLGDAGTFRGQNVFRTESRSGQLTAALDDRAMDQIKKTLENTFKLVSNLEDLYGNVGDNQLMGLAQRITGMNMRSSQDIDRALRQVTQYRGYARGAGVDEKAFLNAVAGTTGMMGQLFGGTEQQAGIRTAALIAGGGTNLLGRYMATGQTGPINEYLGRAALDQAAISRDAGGRALAGAAYYAQRGVLSQSAWNEIRGVYKNDSTNLSGIQQILRREGINLNQLFAGASLEQIEGGLNQDMITQLTGMHAGALTSRRASQIIGRSAFFRGGTVDATRRRTAAERLLAGGVWSEEHLNQLFRSGGNLDFLNESGLRSDRIAEMRGAYNDFMGAYDARDRPRALANLELVGKRYLTEAGADRRLTPEEAERAKLREQAVTRQIGLLSGVRKGPNFLANFADAVLYGGQGDKLDREYALLASQGKFLTGDVGLQLGLPSDFDSLGAGGKRDAMTAFTRNIRTLFSLSGSSMDMSGVKTRDDVVAKLKNFGIEFNGDEITTTMQRAFQEGGGTFGGMLRNAEFAKLFSSKLKAMGPAGISAQLMFLNPELTTYLRSGDEGIFDVALKSDAATAAESPLLKDFSVKDGTLVNVGMLHKWQRQGGKGAVSSEDLASLAQVVNRFSRGVTGIGAEEEAANVANFREQLKIFAQGKSEKELAATQRALMGFAQEQLGGPEQVAQFKMLTDAVLAPPPKEELSPGDSAMQRAVSAELMGALMRSEIKGQMTLMDKQTNTFEISLNLGEKGT